MMITKIISTHFHYVFFAKIRKVINNYYLKNLIEKKLNTNKLEVIRQNADMFSNKKPLVSVIIPTFNRSKLLTERAIPSVLNQTYSNFEIIIVGDHCTDNTKDLVLNINSDKIKFYNLPQRGSYPSHPLDRWMVAGVTPINYALDYISGDWITHLDDDDEFTHDHIEVLLDTALNGKFEMVYGNVLMEVNPNKWITLGSYPPKLGKISRISALYHSELKIFKYDINSWKYGEPADWNLWRRMISAGVRTGYINKVVGKHYLERTQTK